MPSRWERTLSLWRKRANDDVRVHTQDVLMLACVHVRKLWKDA